MTPSEKANELVEKFSNYACWGRFDDEYENLQNSKRCALIAVDEIISVIDPETNYKTWEFYKHVKQELENL